jgi:protein-tyrosine sulfotransferase
MKPEFLSRTVNQLSAGRLKYGWWSSSYRSKQSPVFIGGASRSGTTLLTALLAAHPELYVGPETGIFNGNRNLEHLMRLTELPLPWLAEQLRHSCSQAEFIERVIGRLATDAGKPRWGEKTPANVRHIDRILGHFPQARFVHIIRDGRDVVCSLRTHPEHVWENGRHVRTGIVNPWPKCIAEWHNDVSAGVAWRSDERYYEVRYEALVDSTEATMAALIDWLRLPWRSEVLTGYRRSGMPNHAALAGPITQAAVGRWRTDLDWDARRLFRGAANELLQALRYSCDESWVDADPVDVEQVAGGRERRAPTMPA